MINFKKTEKEILNLKNYFEFNGKNIPKEKKDSLKHVIRFYNEIYKHSFKQNKQQNKLIVYLMHSIVLNLTSEFYTKHNDSFIKSDNLDFVSYDIMHKIVIPKLKTILNKDLKVLTDSFYQDYWTSNIKHQVNSLGIENVDLSKIAPEKEVKKTIADILIDLNENI